MRHISTAIRFSIPVVLTALTLASCSSSTDEVAEPQTPEPSTEVVTISTTAQEIETATTMAQAPAPAAPAPANPEIAGTPGNLNGEEVRLCTNGDGWGISELAVNANTSCPFAYNVLGALTEGVPSTESIRNYLPRTITAESPTTGQTYTMQCADNGAGTITCAGGDNAKVIMI